MKPIFPNERAQTNPGRGAMKTLLILTMGLLLSGPGLRATPVNLPEEKITLEIPDTWSTQEKPPAIMSARNEERTAAVELLVFPNPGNGMLGPGFVQHLENVMTDASTAHGNTIDFTGEGATTLGGLPSYCVQSKVKLAADGKTVYTRAYPIAANRKIYVLSMQTVDNTKDSELQAIAASFNFTSPPLLPHPSYRKLAYQIGIPAAIALVVIAVIVFLLVRRNRKRSRRRRRMY